MKSFIKATSSTDVLKVYKPHTVSNHGHIHRSLSDSNISKSKLTEKKSQMNQPRPPLSLRPFADRCEVCFKITTFRCQKCYEVYYCSRAHQVDDWEEHRLSCTSAITRFIYKDPVKHQSMVLSQRPTTDSNYEYCTILIGMIVVVKEDHSTLGGKEGVVEKVLHPEKGLEGYVKVRIEGKVNAVQVRYLMIIGSLNNNSEDDSPSMNGNQPSETLEEKKLNLKDNLKVFLKEEEEHKTLSTSATSDHVHTLDVSTRYISKEAKQVNDDSVMQLVEMGFEFSQASAALIKCSGNISRAAEFLFSGEIIDDGDVETNQMLTSLFDNDDEEDETVLMSGDYQIAGRYGEHFSVKAVRYHNSSENGTRLIVAAKSGDQTFLTSQSLASHNCEQVQLDIPDKFIHYHFVKGGPILQVEADLSKASVSGEVFNSTASSEVRSRGLQVQDATHLSETDKINILISHLEFQPNKMRENSSSYLSVVSSGSPDHQHCTGQCYLVLMPSKPSDCFPLYSKSFFNFDIKSFRCFTDSTDDSSTNEMSSVDSHSNNTITVNSFTKRDKDAGDTPNFANTHNDDLDVEEEEKLSQMVGMGIESSQALRALKLNHFDISMAFDSIFNGFDVETTTATETPASIEGKPIEDVLWDCKMCEFSSPYREQCCCHCGCPRI